MQLNKKTLVIGASLKPERYSNKAILMLQDHKHDIVAYGLRKGSVNSTDIVTDWPKDQCFDTVTLYLNPKRQEEYQQAILDLNPLRVVFNPGTENPEFQKKLTAHKIEALEACTLVLLQTNQY